MISQIATETAAYLARHGVPASVVFGRRERNRRLNQGPATGSRIVFVPGDPSGNLGKLGVANHPGQRSETVNLHGVDVTQRSRALRDWRVRMSVHVWVHRGGSEADDFEAAEALLQWTVRAVHHSVTSWHEWGDVSVSEPAEAHNGVELIAALTLNFALVDVPNTVVFPSANVNRGEPPP